jgi:hypothetical protein
MPVDTHLPDTATRVERHTDPDVNAAILARTDAQVAELEEADPAQISARLAELDAEWDIERALQLNAALAASAGLLLGLRVDRRFLLLPAAVLGFLAQHVLHGWCPPIPLLRRLGFRTAREIERERYALKVLRGDFDHVPPPGGANPSRRVRAALKAIDL